MDNSKLVAAVLRLQERKDRIRELKRSLEDCEPVWAWRSRWSADPDVDYDGAWRAITPPDRPECPQFCSKAHPLFEPDPDGHTGDRYLRGDDAAEFIAATWCPACQRNSPKVVEIRQLRKGLGSMAGAVTKLARAALARRAS